MSRKYRVASIYVARVYRFGLVLLRIGFPDRGFVFSVIAIGFECQSVCKGRKIMIKIRMKISK